MEALDNLEPVAGVLFQIAVVIAIWVIGIAAVLRSRLEPMPAVLWLAFCVLVPIIGGLCAIIYFGLRSRQTKRKSSPPR